MERDSGPRQQHHHGRSCDHAPSIGAWPTDPACESRHWGWRALSWPRPRPRSHDLFTAEALEFVRRERAAPFFLYLAYTIPHANNELARKTGNGVEVPEDAPYTHERWSPQQRNYAAMVTRLDRDVGSLLALLASWTSTGSSRRVVAEMTGLLRREHVESEHWPAVGGVP
jgi:arylsulfatase A-like enzyme